MAAVSIIIKMESTAGTGYFITVRKNPRTHPEKWEFRKYDPIVRKYVIFKEKKVK